MNKPSFNLFSAITILILFFSSCTPHNSIVGVYSMRYFPKTTMQINADSTFEFTKNIRNPYLLPFDHPNEYYFITKGTWQYQDNKTITLTSQKDSMAYPLSNIKTFPPRDSTLSYFTFFDAYNDTVKILYVNFSNGSSIGEFHSSMLLFEEDLRKTDTLQFVFYGYRPFTFISGQKVNHDYVIVLKPAFQPGFFSGREFRVKRKRLVDVLRHVKFNRIQNKVKQPLPL